MNHSIRKASASDIRSISELAHEVWPKAYADVITPEQIRFMLEWMYSSSSLEQQLKSGIEFLLAEDKEGHLLGFASYRCLESSHWKLDKLYVRSDLQMKGIGKHLVENVMAAIKQAGGTHLEFQVNRRNKAVGFYQRIGFHILREEDFDIGHGFYMNDYIMGCPIQ